MPIHGLVEGLSDMDIRLESLFRPFYMTKKNNDNKFLNKEHCIIEEKKSG